MTFKTYEIKKLYLEEKMPVKTICKILHISNTTLLKELKLLGIYPRNGFSQRNTKRWNNIDYKLKMVSFRKDKSLEQIYGDNKANEIKQKIGKFTTKRNLENNPMNNLMTRKKSSISIKNAWLNKDSKYHTQEYKDKKEKSSKNYHENVSKEKMLKIGRKISKTKKELIKKGLLNPLKGITNPSKPEIILKDIIEKNNLPFNHVGNGKIYFNGPNHSFNPDFLSKNPKHIIEVFGDYWHNKPSALIKDKERLETYSKYGYKTLIIWEHELINRRGKPLNNDLIIINKINNFLGVK